MKKNKGKSIYKCDTPWYKDVKINCSTLKKIVILKKKISEKCDAPWYKDVKLIVVLKKSSNT